MRIPGLGRAGGDAGRCQHCDDFPCRRCFCRGPNGSRPFDCGSDCERAGIRFFFVPPRLTFAVGDTQYLLTFGVMLGIGLLISELTSRLQAQLRASQQQERRTGQLFRMTRQLSELSGSDFLARTAGRQLEEIFDGEVVIFLREPTGELTLRYGEASSVVAQPINKVVAQWVTTNGRTAGATTDTLPN